MENVKIKINNFGKFLITESFASTTPFLITKRMSFLLVHRDLTNLRYNYNKYNKLSTLHSKSLIYIVSTCNWVIRMEHLNKNGNLSGRILS